MNKKSYRAIVGISDKTEIWGKIDSFQIKLLDFCDAWRLESYAVRTAGNSLEVSKKVNEVDDNLAKARIAMSELLGMF